MALQTWSSVFQATTRACKTEMHPKATSKLCTSKMSCLSFWKNDEESMENKRESEQEIEDEDFPGANTSVDQMEITMLGSILQSTSKLLRAKYNGATIFVDHHSQFTYLHLMTSLDGEQTMIAKE